MQTSYRITRRGDVLVFLETSHMQFLNLTEFNENVDSSRLDYWALCIM